MYEKVIGSKYDKDLSTTQIAAMVRQEIKSAVKAGTLPKGTYSVRKDHHKSIRVRIGLDGPVFEPRYLQDEGYVRGPAQWVDGQPVYPSRYLPHVSAAIKAVEAMLAAYNYDRSDIQSDYFDVNFYAHVGLEASYEEARAALLASQSDGAEVIPLNAIETEPLSVRRPMIESALADLKVEPAPESDQVRFMRAMGLEA